MILYQEFKILSHSLMLFVVALLISCAGPISPFGVIDEKMITHINTDINLSTGVLATNSFKIKNQSNKTNKRAPASFNNLTVSTEENLEILIEGHEVIYHRPHFLRVKILGAEASNLKVFLKYNDKIFNPNFMGDANIIQDHLSKTYTIENLYFNPREDGQLQMLVVDQNHNLIQAVNFHKPLCPIDTIVPIQNWSQFQVPLELRIKFYDLAYLDHINPAFMASLVAQESAFNPKAVSTAKAIGLTQMTDMAADEIEQKILNWPRDNSTRNMNSTQLRIAVLSNLITKEDDWRLDSKLSLLGGVYYLHYLKDYWQRPENYKYLSSLNSPTSFEEVVLASYNSGAARVKYALSNRGPAWLKSNQLNEARNYVNSVLSYCHDFSKPQGGISEN